MAKKNLTIALQATDGFSPTPSDTVNIKGDAANATNQYESCVVYTGAGGTIKVTTVDGTDLTFTNTPAGWILPVVVKRIWATPAPPSGILALVGLHRA
jgi:hypothetical protein